MAAQTGNLVNMNELAITLRIKQETVLSYLTLMRKCFHIELVKPFYKNLRKELVKMPKVFMLDTGLRNALLNNFQPLANRIDKGELWENACFRALVDKYGADNIAFWRTSAGNEVDFVLTEIEEPKAIEVKTTASQIRANAYNIFTNAYPELPLSFAWLQPFDEDFFRRL